MPKTILSRLNPSVNGVNRFISTNIPLDRGYSEYNNIHQKISFVSEQEVLNLARGLVSNSVNISSPKRAKNADGIIDSLSQFFIEKEIILGDSSIVAQTFEKVADTIKDLYRNKKKLVFTLLGYPNKMPNPLYTNSTSVDLAEIVSLCKLYYIMEFVDKVYPYGVELLLLTENSIFYTMSDLSFQEQEQYLNNLCFWEEKIDAKKLITVKDIQEFHTDQLTQEWKKLTSEFEKLYNTGDADVIDKIESVMPSNFATLNYRQYKLEFLLKFFDPNYYDETMEKLRVKYYERSLKESFYYIAYHQARYRLKFMDKQFPNSLRFTVAPKVGSIGINMLNTKSKMLPYYGYIVTDKKDYEVKYITDINPQNTAVYYEKELTYPFYFITDK